MNYKVKVIAVGLQQVYVRVVEADSLNMATLLGASMVAELNEGSDFRHALLGVFESTGLFDKDGKEVFDNDLILEKETGLFSMIHYSDEGVLQIASSNKSIEEILTDDKYMLALNRVEVNV